MLRCSGDEVAFAKWLNAANPIHFQPLLLTTLAEILCYCPLTNAKSPIDSATCPLKTASGGQLASGFLFQEAVDSKTVPDLICARIVPDKGQIYATLNSQSEALFGSRLHIPVH